MKIRLLYGSMLVIAVIDAQAYVCTTLTPNTVLTPPPLTIPKDLPVGSPIGNEIISGEIVSHTCTNSEPLLSHQEYGIKGLGDYVTSIGGRRVYSTNIEGIGYAVGGTTVSPCPGATHYVDGQNTMDGNLNNRNFCYINGMFGTQPMRAIARIQFYKTAPTTGNGTVAAKQVGAIILRNNLSSWHFPESTFSIAAFSVKNTLSCAMNTTVISVPMGTVEKREFNGPGTWPGNANTRNFNISLNCNAGIRVNLQIDGNAQNASQGILNLNGGTDSASGVGIQLLHKNAPLPLSTVITTGTAVTEGEYSIPLQARYLQTQSTVTPGSANSSATISLTYQ